MTAAGELNCAQALARLDTRLDGELTETEAATLARHLENCATCSAVLANRMAVRERLRKVVRSAQPAPGMAVRVRSGISAGNGRNGARWGFLAAAALVLLTVGGYNSWKNGHFRMTPESRLSYIASIVPEVAPIMRVGLQQHVHCAVFRSYSAQNETVAQLAGSLGPQFAALVPVLQARVPAGFQVVLAHRCNFNGRQYIHVVARRKSELISLLITQRSGGEAFESDLRAVASEAGTPVYSSGIKRFSIAGFETSRYLVYLVSDLSQTENATVFEAMTPALRTDLS